MEKNIDYFKNQNKDSDYLKKKEDDSFSNNKEKKYTGKKEFVEDPDNPGFLISKEELIKRRKKELEEK